MDTPQSLKNQMSKLAGFYNGYVLEFGEEFASTILFCVVRYLLEDSFEAGPLRSEDRIITAERIVADVTEYVRAGKCIASDG